jgi:phosphopantothenoylcysteine decarboxylase / phosphopantothenate---cysteine ligase
MVHSNPKHIVIGITGGIAAYKSLSLIRLFKTAHFEVRVVATKNALEFVTKLTIETLAQSKLYYDSFESTLEYSVEHISLADWADAVIVAPATANIIGKLAHGIADDALSTFLLAVTKPIFIAPAMNCNMLNNVAVQDNMKILTNRGIHLIEPNGGFLACGYEGKGRMEEPDQIFAIISQSLMQNQIFKGFKTLVTAGPTFEPIDPVRFIGNHSSGLMGFAIAESLAKLGADVTLVSGPTHLEVFHSNIDRLDVQTAQEMYDVVMNNCENKQLIVMAAAVADYSPKSIALQKIKKNSSDLTLELKKTKDILAELGHNKKNNQCVVGFALETENELVYATQKLQNKNADFIVLNSMNNNDAGFNKPTNQITILSKNGIVFESDIKSKQEIADDIIQTVYQNFFSPNFEIS